MLDQYALHSTPVTATSARDLVAHIERLVRNGTLAAGDRIPPVRTMADLVDLAPNTVASAYRDLTARGLLVGRGRHGTFVTQQTAVPATEPAVPDGLVDLMSGNPDPRLLPDLTPHLRRLELEQVLYGAPGVDEVFEETARRLLAGGGVPPGRIAVVGGALDGVERALLAHLRLGDRVAVEAPGWPAVTDLIRTIGFRPVPVPLDDRGMRPDGLAELLGSVAAVVLTPRGQNPTGAAHDAERVTNLVEVLGPHPDVLVVEDDHAGLIAGVDLAVVGPSLRRWVYVQSVSKSLGPDLRVAVLTGDDLTTGRIQARQAAGPGWVSHILQRLVADLLADDGVARLLARATRAYQERREGLVEGLAAAGIEATGRTGVNVWMPVDDQSAVVAAMAARGYAVSAGERWRMGTPPAVRISIGSLDADQLDPVVEALGEAVTGAPGATPGRRV